MLTMSFIRALLEAIYYALHPWECIKMTCSPISPLLNSTKDHIQPFQGYQSRLYIAHYTIYQVITVLLY